MSKAIYCRCLGTYTQESNCDKKDCPYPEYWKQGIGDISDKGSQES